MPYIRAHRNDLVIKPNDEYGGVGVTWLLPRIGRWRERHPHLALEIDSSQQLVDLQRDGFHAALRYGTGPWPGLESERLFDTPMRMIVVASPPIARRLQNAPPEALARESLLGERELWELWFAAAGLPIKLTPVAIFNDAGLMLQAAEQDLGLALSRELLAADALADGRLSRVSALSIAYEPAHAYHLVYPPSVRDWPPLAALRQWLRDELELSRGQLELTRKALQVPRGQAEATDQEPLRALLSRVPSLAAPSSPSAATHQSWRRSCAAHCFVKSERRQCGFSLALQSLLPPYRPKPLPPIIRPRCA